MLGYLGVQPVDLSLAFLTRLPVEASGELGRVI
jgi:hypothetical protein